MIGLNFPNWPSCVTVQLKSAFTLTRGFAGRYGQLTKIGLNITKNKMGQSERQVVDVLGVWANGKGPLHRQLTDALRSAIHRRDLAPGYKLPAERELA
jgi:hypothetical protein